jgi:hypothetical protein
MEKYKIQPTQMKSYQGNEDTLHRPSHLKINDLQRTKNVPLFQKTSTNTTIEGISRSLHMLALFQQGMTSTTSHILPSQFKVTKKN